MKTKINSDKTWAARLALALTERDKFKLQRDELRSVLKSVLEGPACMVKRGTFTLWDKVFDILDQTKD